MGFPICMIHNMNSGYTLHGMSSIQPYQSDSSLFYNFLSKKLLLKGIINQLIEQITVVQLFMKSLTC